MNIGIYGGTFDPPHLGHMESARAAITELGLDKLIFMPAKIPPHKKLPTNGASPEQRLEMARLMADGLLLPDVIEVSALELERTGSKSYTVDTLRQLRQEYPDDNLWLLMGTDMLLSLHTWRKPKEIMSRANIAAFVRAESDSSEQMEAQCQQLREHYGAQVRLLPLPKIHEVSSTQVRGQGTGENLWPPVWGYILREGLYGTSGDLKGLSDADLRAVSYSMIRAKRIAHVQGTEEEAVKLAHHWGANEEHARRAAILHDCTKYLELDEQLALCEKHHVELDELEQQAVKLLHAKTGAALARDLFGEPEEICQAIHWHTTGRADMSLLEKILYIADYMEPTRNFDGVERLRELAYTDLNAAVCLGAEMSIQDMEQRGSPIHPNTLAARDSLKGTEAMDTSKRKKGGTRLAPKEPKDKKAGSRKKKIRLAILITLAVLLALAITAFAVHQSVVKRPTIPDLSVKGNDIASTVEGLETAGDRKKDFFTFLIIGRDTGGGGNTDTVLLAAYDIDNQKLNVMSIPRDTMVNVPWDMKKINSVYNFYGGGDKGIEALYKEVSQLVGFVPDFEVVVEWDAVGELVEAIDGVWFDVPWNMNYDDPTQNLHIHVNKGYQKLNGDQAMGVVRWRQNNDGSHSDMGDIGRIEIQQAFLKAVIQQCLTIQNATKIQTFAQIFTENVQTDLTIGNLVWFAEQAIFGGLSMDNVNFITMPGNYNATAWSRTYKNYQSYVLPDGEELLKVVNENFNPYLVDRTAVGLDIMSVNADGTLSSSTGVVEDTQAAGKTSGSSSSSSSSSSSKPSSSTSTSNPGVTSRPSATQSPRATQPPHTTTSSNVTEPPEVTNNPEATPTPEQPPEPTGEGPEDPPVAASEPPPAETAAPTPQPPIIDLPTEFEPNSE